MKNLKFKHSSLPLQIALMALVLLLPFAAVAQEEPPDYVIGVGMAYDPDDFVGPATIEFLYEEFNMGILDDGDIILEYRGFPVGSGAELHQLLLDLPDVALGDPVDMLVVKQDGAVVQVAPMAAAVVDKNHDFTIPDRECVTSKACLCSKTKKGSTCIRTVTIVKDENGKIVSTSASCADGVNSCNTPPPKKGK